MKSIFKQSIHSPLKFIIKILAYTIIFNVTAFPVLLIFKIPLRYAFSLILPYEGFFLLAIGSLSILCTYIYKKNSLPYRFGTRTGWFDFRKFAKLTSEERHRYRQEGKIMMIIGFSLWLATIILHFFNL